MVEPRRKPKWAMPYLQLTAWTQDELRNLLCGFSPVSPWGGKPIPDEIKESTRLYMEVESRRLDADRHVRDAVLVGELAVVEPPDDRLLEKIREVLSVAELDAVKRALAHERVCKQSYKVDRDVAIRWASSRRQLFPDFPFSSADLPGGGQSLNEKPTRDLIDHRRMLLEQCLENEGITREAFCKGLGISKDALRGIVNGDRKRYAEDTEQRVLKRLSVTRSQWNRRP